MLAACVLRAMFIRVFDQTVSEFNEQWTLLFVTAKGWIAYVVVCIFVVAQHPFRVCRAIRMKISYYKRSRIIYACEVLENREY